MGSQSLIEDKEVFYFMNTEIFKPIPNFEGMYEVSNLGNIKSIKFNKEKILKPGKNSCGYLIVSLSKNDKSKTYYVHKLVAITFLNHIPCGYKLVCDHINNDPLDNRLDNLQIITQRENICKIKNCYSSQYKDVSWKKQYKKWCSQIFIKDKNFHLGYFKDEYQAHLAYQNALQNI